MLHGYIVPRPNACVAQGFRHPWHDHPTPEAYLAYHEERWLTEDAAEEFRDRGKPLPPNYHDSDEDSDGERAT